MIGEGHISTDDFVKWGHLSADIGACSICESREEIEKHHTSYNPGKVIYVCRACHWRVHYEPGYCDELDPFSEESDTVDVFDSDARRRRSEPNQSTIPYSKQTETYWPESPSDTCEPGKHDMIWSACARRICAFCGRTKQHLVDADFYYYKNDTGEQSRLIK